MRSNPAKAKAMGAYYDKIFQMAKDEGMTDKQATAKVYRAERKRKAAAKKAAKTRAASKTKRKTKKRSTKKGGVRKTARRAYTKKRGRKKAKTPAHVRRWRKIAKTEGQSRGRRSIARASLTAYNARKKKSSGTLDRGASRLLTATGLKARRNPGLTGTLKDLGTLAPAIGATAASVVGFTVLGMKVGAMLAPKLTMAPAMIRQNIVPITTGVLTATVWTLLKASKMSKWSFPVLMGGMSAAILQWMIHSKIGQDLAAKVGYPLKLADSSDLTEASGVDEVQAVADVEALKGLGAYSSKWGLGEYMPVSQYMGAYEDAGPSLAFGEYTASNYPVHSPGPGDNRSVHGRIIRDKTIGGYGGFGDYTTQDSGIYDQALPSVTNSLLATPGGTIVTGGTFSPNTASGQMLGGGGILTGSDRW